MIPTSTKLTVQLKTAIPKNAVAIVVFVPKGVKKILDGEGLEKTEIDSVNRMLAAGISRGKAREVVYDLIDESASKQPRRVFIAGLGEPKKITSETVRETAGALARAFKKHRVKSVAILPEMIHKISSDSATEAIISGLMLASFEYEEYKGSIKNKKSDDDDKDAKAPLEVTIVVAKENQKAIAAVIDRAMILAEGQNFARTIASRPGNDINPPTLAKVAQQLSREVGLGLKVYDEKQLAKMGMGGILAVGAGAIATPPRLIVLEHKPRAAKGKTLLVVGKAITFDTGGISIKPADKMGQMIYDKCGGMAVLGLMYALAKTKLPVHVVGILSSAENHISSRAYRPGDILKMYNGVTVEVTNTDAEGRLVLGDALAWGIETYKPAAVIDLATLTGGCVVALGETIAGLMCNDDNLVAEISAAAEKTGEKLWRLPLSDEAKDMLKSNHADIINSAGRWASPLQGGVFLQHFVPENVPWAHLDIAGVAETERELPLYGKGATGWGIRTLFEWIVSRM